MNKVISLIKSLGDKITFWSSNVCQEITFKQKVIFIIFVAILCQFPLLNFTSAEHDEQYTMLLFRYSWREMLEIIITEDGHPPLSYIYHRLFAFGTWNNIFMLHMSSLFLLIASGLLGYFPVRRLLGEKKALLFIICIFTMPPVFRLATNMRMYPLAFFLITGIFVYAQSILYCYHKKDWLYLTLFTILSLYTHYYCVLLSVIIWLQLFFLLCQKKDYKQMRLYFIYAIIVSLIYIPWIFVFLKQYFAMHKLWYPSVEEVLKFIDGVIFMQYIFVAKKVSYLAKTICMIFGTSCMIFTCQFLFCSNRKNKPKTDMSISLNAFLIIIIFLYISAMLSFYIRPFLEYRYTIIMGGLQYIMLVCALQNMSEHKKIFYPLLIISYVLNYSQFITYAKDAGYAELRNYFKENIPSNALIIYNESSSNLALKFYLPEYAGLYVPVSKSIILLKNEVLDEREKLKKLSFYDGIYTLSPANLSRTCDHIIFNNFYIPGEFCISKISEKSAKKIISFSETNNPY